ncbi:hypothetical protein [Streptomyces phaeochromogenes]|uniref:hypothetical protein n=1 Tax=Streptomyces phaeochromogenes TaxID=1923 RepID=UPI00386A098A
MARAQQLARLALGDRNRQCQAEQALVGCLTDDRQLTQLIDASLCHGWAGLMQTVFRAAAEAIDELAAHPPRARCAVLVRITVTCCGRALRRCGGVHGRALRRCGRAHGRALRGCHARTVRAAQGAYEGGYWLHVTGAAGSWTGCQTGAEGLWLRRSVSDATRTGT